jgi:ABC-type transport system involved in multi-copper enzyme maturation permease subunit
VNCGVLSKIIRETWLPVLLFGLAIFAFEMLLTFLLPRFEETLGQIFSSLPFMRHLFQALVGTEFGDEFSSENLRAIVWVHPTILALLWAQEIVFCTRVPAGEIDRGTIDVLLSWPVSRRKLFVCEAVAWLASGLWMVAMVGAGHLLASWIAPTDAPPALRPILIVLVNLFCVYVAVGGVAWLVSAASDRRGRAVAAVFGLVLAPFLLNFLVQFWQEAAWLEPLGLLHYYQPARIFATNAWPLFDMTVLLVAGGFSWLLALETFARRSICTL